MWLEPGYDYGRYAAWMLDLPGAFGWAASREMALSQASSGMGWFRDWLARHGERLDAAWGRPEVVEEVAATVVDGYERNATFAADDEPVSEQELTAAIRRLGFARVDLLDVAGRVDAFEAAGGTLAADDDRESNDRLEAGRERTSDEILRHIGAAEAWFASRLDPAARFDGAARNGDPRAWLDATRAWGIDHLRRFHAQDPAMARIDGKGERWTLRKLVRRFLYHSIDHLQELDRRLARAEGRATRLVFRRDRLTDVMPLARLLRSVGWDRRSQDRDRLRQAIDGSHAMTSAWDGEELVAFVRELGDGVFSSVVSMVVVDPRWQGLGLAERLIDDVIAGRDDVRFTLGAAPGLKPFYAKLGFEDDDGAMVRRPSH